MEPLVRHCVLMFLDKRELGFTACVNKTWRKDADRCEHWFDLATKEIHGYIFFRSLWQPSVPSVNEIRRHYASVQRTLDWKRIYRVISAYWMYINRPFFVYTVHKEAMTVDILTELKCIGWPCDVFVHGRHRITVTPLGWERFVFSSVQTNRTKTYERISDISRSMVEFLTGIEPDAHDWLIDHACNGTTWLFTCDVCHAVLNPVARIEEKTCPACRRAALAACN